MPYQTASQKNKYILLFYYVTQKNYNLFLNLGGGESENKKADQGFPLCTVYFNKRSNLTGKKTNLTALTAQKKKIDSTYQKAQLNSSKTV